MGGLLPGLGRVIWRGRGSVGRYGLRLSGQTFFPLVTSAWEKASIADLYHVTARAR